MNPWGSSYLFLNFRLTSLSNEAVELGDFSNSLYYWIPESRPLHLLKERLLSWTYMQNVTFVPVTFVPFIPVYFAQSSRLLRLFLHCNPVTEWIGFCVLQYFVTDEPFHKLFQNIAWPTHFRTLVLLSLDSSGQPSSLLLALLSLWAGSFQKPHFAPLDKLGLKWCLQAPGIIPLHSILFLRDCYHSYNFF